jgi:outer membrane immunogenic protein
MNRPSLINGFFLLTLGAVNAIALVGSTLAGPGPTEKNITPVPSPCDWTGFYVGVNAGVAEFQPTLTDLDYSEGYGSLAYSNTAFIGGGQLGYNWQMNNLVLGLEVDASGSTADVRIRHDFGSITPGHTFNDDKASVDFLGTIRPRIGVAFQNALLYVTAGGAYAHGSWEQFVVNPTFSIQDEFWKGEDWRWGWTGGGGLEYMLGCHWTLRAEVLYTHLGSDTVNGVLPNNPTNTHDARLQWRFDDDIYNVRVGINYKFGSFFGSR